MKPSGDLLVEEHFLVGVFEGKIQGLGGEVADDVGKIAAPEGSESLFLRDADEDIDDSLVAFIDSNAGGSILDLKTPDSLEVEAREWTNLKEQLDTFNRSDGGFGDGSSSSTRGEIDQEFSCIEALLLGCIFLERFCSFSHLGRDVSPGNE